MERREVQTPLGEVWLWGAPEAFDGDGPVALVIRGAMARRHALERWRPEGAQPVFAHLPGFHCPLLSETSVEAFAAAFDSVVQQTFSARQVSLISGSVGAWVAGAMVAQQVCGRVLIDPFYSTDRPWLIEATRCALAVNGPDFRDWVWRILGIAEDRLEVRCYRRFLSTRGPVVAVVADDGLATADDRERLAGAGAILMPVSGNHDVPVNDPAAFDRAWARLQMAMK